MALLSMSRRYVFEASHQLPNVPAHHKCSRLHGHTYELMVEISGDISPVLGWAIDFFDLDEVVRHAVLSKLDHRHLNDIFKNPTTEIVALQVAEWLQADLASTLKLVSVEISENPDSRVRWTP